MTDLPNVRSQLAGAGYAAGDIDKGIAYALSKDAPDNDEGLALSLSRILFHADDVAEGARYGVEPGSVGWSSPGG